MSFIDDGTIKNLDETGWIQSSSASYEWIRHNLIQIYYPRLNKNDQDLLLQGVVRVINWICLKYGFGTEKSPSLLWDQLVQNNLQDLRAILASLLPYINNDTDEKKKQELTELRDLYLKKNQNGDYVYTNCQYDRCVRTMRNGQTEVTYRPYLSDYFCHNNLLLLSSIEASANKLFVNWIDVLPIRMDRYRSTSLYNHTLIKFQTDYTKENFKLIYHYLDPKPGLSYQDIYNVLVNHFYHDVKNQKWIIYDIIEDGRAVTYISVIEKYLPLASVWQGSSWSQISNGERALWSARWKSMLQSPDDRLRLIVSKIYAFFVSNHVNSRRLINQGKLKLTSDVSEIEDEEAKVSAETTRNAQIGMFKVPPEEVYLFFLNELTIFRKSWFYYVTRVSPLETISETLPNGQIIYLTPKNFYNYAKSIANVLYNGKYTEIPRHWQSLPQNYLQTAIIRLTNYPVLSAPLDHMINDWENPNWFNLNRYFRRLYPDVDSKNLLLASKVLHDMIRTKIIDAIFESMIFRGILSEFMPIPQITDNIRISNEISSTEEYKMRTYRRTLIRKLILNKENMESYQKHTYHFMAGMSYGDLPLLSSPDFGGPSYSMNYLDYISTFRDQSWVFTYAVNWICQWGFFHHYLNNRVLYVTGATGLGKSTQVPKLLLYSQKILDYKTDGKIICTLPRVPPTVGTAETISMEMGVPIRRYDPNYKKSFFSGNFFIQFRHQAENHMLRNENFLRTVTDGTLYAELIKYPFMTKVNPEKKIVNSQGQKIDWMIQCSSENVYDIIIVDEAHEHNPNMDMILTMMRDVSYVNNSVKLAIISATMDDDEPIYRRYYRDINDNRAYPLNSFIEICPLDRANVDRRIDISPPGKTTQYAVKDIYLPKAQADLINARNHADFAINKAIDIVNSTDKYHLLLFMAGQKDILNAVKKINDRTLSSVVALPYYSSLSEDTKRSIAKIHETLPKYTRRKEDVLLPEEMIVNRVPEGTYQRAVIIATNIAEASISLKDLKYVVDSGYAKSIIHDPMTGNLKNVTQMISRVSSTQRRGRVGRMMEGEVYYMYDEDRIRNNKTTYLISITDFTDKLTSLIQKQPTDIPLITEGSDINHIQLITDIREKVRDGYASSSSETPYHLMENPRTYLEIIKNRYTHMRDLSNPRQYYLYYGRSSSTMIDETLEVCGANGKERDFVISEYAGPIDDDYYRRNHNDYPYQTLLSFVTRRHTGYSDKQLLDDDLNFFIIHPDEGMILRDMYTGRVIGLKNCQFEKGSYCSYTVQLNGLSVKEIIQPSYNFKGFRFFRQYLALMEACYQMIIAEVPLTSIDLAFRYTDIKTERVMLRLRNYFGSLGDQLTTGTGAFWEPGKVNCLSNYYQKLIELEKTVNLDIVSSSQNNLIWYSLALARGIEEDVLALMCLIEAFPDFKSWIYNVNGISDVKKFFDTNRDPKGDIHFIWNFWKKTRNHLETILPLLTISASLESLFHTYRDQYYQNSTILPADQRMIMDKMFYRGELGTEHEFYYYVSNINFDVEAFLKGVHIEKIMGGYVEISNINPVSFTAFLEAYCSTIHQQNKNLWLHQYEIDHKLSNEENVSQENLLEWIRTNFTFRPLFNHQNQWDLFLDTYTRAYCTNAVFNLPNNYRGVDLPVNYERSYWSDKIRLPMTLFNSSSSVLIYHNINENSSTSALTYLTPVELQWIFDANPYYFFLLIYSPESVIGQKYRLDDNPETLATLEKYRQMFDIGSVVQFLEDLKDPVVSKIIRQKLQEI
jgi:hypothetical protein